MTDADDPVVEQTKLALAGDKEALTALIDTPLTPEQAKLAMGLPVPEVSDWVDPAPPEEASQAAADAVLALEQYPEAVRAAEGVRPPSDLPEHDTPEAPDDDGANAALAEGYTEEDRGGDDQHRDDPGGARD